MNRFEVSQISSLAFFNLRSNLFQPFSRALSYGNIRFFLSIARYVSHGGKKRNSRKRAEISHGCERSWTRKISEPPASRSSRSLLFGVRFYDRSSISNRPSRKRDVVCLFSKFFTARSFDRVRLTWRLTTPERAVPFYG